MTEMVLLFSCEKGEPFVVLKAFKNEIIKQKYSYFL